MTTYHGGKVLLVDDEKNLTFILSAHLRSEGYEVMVAEDGLSGVDLAREWRPDVIVLDINLPGIDGFEVTRRLKQDTLTHHIPIIMITARSRTEDLIAGLEAGADEYVAKPFEIAELLARVRTVMRLAAMFKELDKVNNRLANEVMGKTLQLELLYHYVRSLNETDRVERIYDLIINTVRRLTGSSRISLLLREEDGETLRCVRALGIPQEVAENIRVRGMDGLAGKVFISGKTLVAHMYSDGNLPQDSSYTSEAFLCTPLVLISPSGEQEIVGVLNVTNREDGKPFSQDEVDCIRSIADSGAIAIRHMQQRVQLSESVKVLLLTVGQLAEYRDEETADHLDRVARYARILATELAKSPQYARTITPQFIEDICTAAPMHDIGKVGIPDEILTKPGRLSPREFEIMKTHTEIGRRTLDVALHSTGSAPILQMCVDIAYGHHEKWNGTGYPRGISGENIPLAARIIALVDAYDAITSPRRYSQARSHETAVEIMRLESGAHFDPVVVEAFLRCADEFDSIRRTYFGSLGAASNAAMTSE